MKCDARRAMHHAKHYGREYAAWPQHGQHGRNNLPLSGLRVAPATPRKMRPQHGRRR